MIPQISIIGSGMIVHDQILPSLLHLQRLGAVGPIAVVAQHAGSVSKLAASETIQGAFPGQTFDGHPSEGYDPNLYKDVISPMPAGNIVVVAVPDQLHFEVVMTALRQGQHVCCVKPLVLTAAESLGIEREARERGLLVAVEYHKRFDDRSLMARRRYRAGAFGEFKLGTAALMEKWYYRHSNFQNWCTTENSDAFTYIGCHYVDLVHFITGLLPVSVSVYGIRDRFPNGNEGFLWTDARVLWSNGAALNVQNSLSFPDDAPGSNTQGLTMYCGTRDKGAWIRHDDQYRGVQHCRVDDSPGYSEPSPDYFQYVEWAGDGLMPVGYGYRSIEAIVKACVRVQADASALEEIEQRGLIATPRNSRYNELVVEAGRLSILNDAREAIIEYGSTPRVYLRN